MAFAEKYSSPLIELEIFLRSVSTLVIGASEEDSPSGLREMLSTLRFFTFFQLSTMVCSLLSETSMYVNFFSSGTSFSWEISLCRAEKWTSDTRPFNDTVLSLLLSRTSTCSFEKCENELATTMELFSRYISLTTSGQFKQNWSFSKSNIASLKSNTTGYVDFPLKIKEKK